MRLSTYVILLVVLVSSMGSPLVWSQSPGPIERPCLPDRPLTWADFAGTPDPKILPNALVSWDLYWIRSEATGLPIELIAKFNPLQSWVRIPTAPETPQNRLLLQHENGHWSIVCLLTRQGQLLLGKQADPRSFAMDLPGKFRLINQRYDQDTNHGRQEATQQLWMDYITAGLPGIDIEERAYIPALSLLRGLIAPPPTESND